MFDFTREWARLLDTGASLSKTSAQAWETLAAANSVITARTGLIQQALCTPMQGDYAELGRMLPEKIDAFGRAGAAGAGVVLAAQSAWFQQWQAMGALTLRGTPPSVGEWADTAGQIASLSLATVTIAADFNAKTLAPVHARATANARRLRKRKQPSD
ncbi:MAG: hypothetical protein ACKOUM_02775 [Sphingopyxis sp.]